MYVGMHRRGGGDVLGGGEGRLQVGWWWSLGRVQVERRAGRGVSWEWDIVCGVKKMVLL
jgi:hypothetical protein